MKLIFSQGENLIFVFIMLALAGCASKIGSGSSSSSPTASPPFSPINGATITVSTPVVVSGSSVQVSWNGDTASSCIVYVSNAATSNGTPWNNALIGTGSISNIVSDTTLALNCTDSAGKPVLPMPTTFVHVIQGGQVFSVDAYGAVADGRTDSTAAVSNAIQAAVNSGRPAEVVFSAGTYLLNCPVAGVCFNINGSNNLSIIGQGSAATQLIIANPLSGFLSISNATNIMVSGFSVDYSSLPFTQGTVTNVYPNAIDLSVESGYPALDQPLFAPNFLAQTFGMLFTAGTTSLKGNASNAYFVSSISRNGNGTFRVALSTSNGIAVNDQFALPNRSQTMINFSSNRNVYLNQVVLYTGPGPASIWQENHGQIIINGFEVRRKPGTTRLLSTAADAIHMVNNNANLTIENCYIEGMGDDALNTRSLAYPLASLPTATTFTFNSVPSFEIGNTVQDVDSAGKVRGTAKIIALQVNPNNTETITLDQSIAGAAAGDLVFARELASANALIQNNTFSNFRGIFRIRSSDAIFMNNQILDARNALVLIADDIEPSWQEGPSLQNSLDGVYFSNNSVSGGSLSLLGYGNANLGAPPLTGLAALLKHPLVFNAGVYRSLNPDLANLSDQAIASHWVQSGISEGRQANIEFHSTEYMQLYPELTQAFSATGYQYAITQYLLGGAILERRQGSIYTNSLVYDSAFYRSNQADVSSLNDTQLGIHWLLHGMNEGRRASQLFFSVDYLNRYPDLYAAFGPNYGAALKHFVLHGYSEGRNGQ